MRAVQYSDDKSRSNTGRRAATAIDAADIGVQGKIAPLDVRWLVRYIGQMWCRRIGSRG